MKSKIGFLFMVLEEQLEGISIADIIGTIFFAFIITLIFFYVSCIKKKKMSVGIISLVFWSVFYFEITIFITLVRRTPGSEYYSGKIVPYLEWGDISGSTYSLKQVIYNLFNVVLFIPIGFLIRAWRNNNRGIKNFILSLLTGFLVSFVIETTQLITKRGTFELSDLVTNFIGACVGILIYELYLRIQRHERI